MWVDLPNWAIALVNGLGIPLWQIGVAWMFVKMPDAWFKERAGFFECLPGESGGIYERWLRVKWWKDLIPDAAPWFGGAAKKTLSGRSREALERFLLETRRGEWAHWVQMLGLAAFLTWTPMPGAWIVVGWAVISNLPCIVLQRQNRMRIRVVLIRDRTRFGRPGGRQS